MGYPAFYEKNKIDMDVGDRVTITVTDSVATDAGNDFVDYLRNRDNTSGWATTGSTDAANTQLDILFGESHEIDRILLIGINWKTYTIQYWNGSAYVDFSTAISETVNADSEKEHSFTDVETERIRIIITGTMTANDDKVATQIIVTQHIGTLNSEPFLADVEVSKNRRTVEMLSGKKKIQRNVGAHSFVLQKAALTNSADLTVLETLHEYHHGFLVWPCAGTSRSRVFWRKKDIFLMNLASELRPEFNEGRFGWGMNVSLQFVEVI